VRFGGDALWRQIEAGVEALPWVEDDLRATGAPGLAAGGSGG
jgi:hypothetical protein